VRLKPLSTVFALPLLLLLVPTIASAAPSPSVEAYGTSNETRIFYGPADFSPESDVIAYERFTGLQVTAPADVIRFFLVPHLPNGAVITSIALESCDNSASNHMHLVLGDCDETVTPCGSLILEGQVDTTNNGCHIGNAAVGSYAPDNFNHRPLLELIFDNPDPQLSFRGAFLTYVLQVSPAPATATFADVPTNHPFFQFIEALAASGITGGCGSGNYCPDNPVTRGQMAVFLSKALGLNFPD
jgi:hypothetical protein